MISLHSTGTLLAVVTLLALPGASSAQHEMHGMTMGGGWRMVPMDMSMPMLPGIEGAVPVVGPFMPGMGMDPAMLPEARPSEVVPLADELGIWFDPAAYPGSELYKQELKRGSYRYNNGGLGLALGALLVPTGGLIFAIPELSPDIDHAPVTIGVGSTILGLGAIGLIAGSGVRARTKREIDERYGRSEGSAPSAGTSRR